MRAAYFESRTFISPYRLDVIHFHQPGHPVLAASQARFVEITEDAWTAVDAHALVVELSDLQGQHLVDLGPWRGRVTQLGVITAA